MSGERFDEGLMSIGFASDEDAADVGVCRDRLELIDQLGVELACVLLASSSTSAPQAIDLV